jgi:hypothetical protein
MVKGNETDRMYLSPMDVVYVCEHGLVPFALPRLQGGEEIEVEEVDPDKLPDIELKCLDVAEMGLSKWSKDIEYEGELFNACFL